MESLRDGQPNEEHRIFDEIVAGIEMPENNNKKMTFGPTRILTPAEHIAREDYLEQDGK